MPRKAFLKKKSLLDRFKDDYATHTGYIQSARAKHTWNNPLTRSKRTKKLNGWIKSFAGKDHIRKLSRFNAVQAHRHESIVIGESAMQNEAMSLKGFIENLSDKLVNKYGLEKDVVKNYLNLHTEEMQELLDDKELSLKEKVLFVRSEITGEKDEGYGGTKSVMSIWGNRPRDVYPEVSYSSVNDMYNTLLKYGYGDKHPIYYKNNSPEQIKGHILGYFKWTPTNSDADIEADALAAATMIKNNFNKFETKKNEVLVLPNPTIIYKGPIEDAKKACHYVSKILADKGLGWGRVSWQAPKDGEFHYGHPEKDVYTVTLRGSNDLIKDSFAVYKDVFGNDFWNNCDANPRGWVNPQTIARYDVATPRQESKKHEARAKMNFNAMGRLVAQFFNGNNKYYKAGPWHIANGGYDLIAEIYYNNEPVIDIIKGPRIDNCSLDFNDFLGACKVLDPIMKQDYGKTASYNYDGNYFNNLSQMEKYATINMFEDDVFNELFLQNYDYSDDAIDKILKYVDTYYMDNDNPTISDCINAVISEFNLKLAESKEPANEKLGYEKGHKNSKGEDAPWVIRSHEDNRILASFATEDEAKKHLQRMKQYSKGESKKSEGLSNEKVKDSVKFAATEAGLEDYLKVDSDGAMSVTVSLPINSEKLKTVRWVIDSNEGTIEEYLDTEKNLVRDFTDDQSLVSMLTLLFQTARMSLRHWLPKKSEALLNKEELEEPVNSYISDVFADLVVSFHWGEDGAKKFLDKYNDVILANYAEGEMSAYETARYIDRKENPYPLESKKKQESKKNEGHLDLVDTIVVPKWLWDAFYFADEYGETLNEEEEEILADFKAKYADAKYHLETPEEEADFRSHNDFDNYGGPCYDINVYERK